jgi:hypothetical protein
MSIWSCGPAGEPLAKGIMKISYAGDRFPCEIIQQAIWLYPRFTLSFRDVEDLLAERGITVSCETVPRWVNHFGPAIAADLPSIPGFGPINVQRHLTSARSHRTLRAAAMRTWRKRPQPPEIAHDTVDSHSQFDNVPTPYRLVQR